MIDIDVLRKETEAVIANLARRGIERTAIEELLAVDTSWRELTEKADSLRAQQNEANSAIAQASADEKKEHIAKMRTVSDELKSVEDQLQTVTSQREQLWRQLPNLLQDDVPDGGEDNFELIKTVPEAIPTPSFALKSYLDLAQPHLIDLDRAAKVSGSRFVYLRGELARLQMALVSFVFDTLAPDNFIPVIPPVLINHQAMAGMGYLDKHAEEIYQTQDDLVLVGTSEQSIGPMHSNEKLDMTALPLRYVGYSSCFRREAGSHGKDVRGIIRMHQFDKVEMFSFTTPDQSATEHDFLLAQQEKIVQALELPYRVIKLAAQDLGMPSAKTYDIETWIPSEGRYRETHSTSNTTDYQARRLNIRVGSTKAHMLNGTAIALSRTLIALIENHQQADGSIGIPKALHPYLPFTTIPARPA